MRERKDRGRKGKRPLTSPRAGAETSPAGRDATRSLAFPRAFVRAARFAVRKHAPRGRFARNKLAAADGGVALDLGIGGTRRTLRTAGAGAVVGETATGFRRGRGDKLATADGGVAFDFFVSAAAGAVTSKAAGRARSEPARTTGEGRQRPGTFPGRGLVGATKAGLFRLCDRDADAATLQVSSGRGQGVLESVDGLEFDVAEPARFAVDAGSGHADSLYAEAAEKVFEVAFGGFEREVADKGGEGRHRGDGDLCALRAVVEAAGGSTESAGAWGVHM